METMTLPDRDEMLRAFAERDASYEGVFFTCVRTTGIFCRPTCVARPPKPENVEFRRTVKEALQAGYRPCKRCRPLEPLGAEPDWVTRLLTEVERDPSKRWRDADLRELGLSPSRVRRWFSANHGMTFHAYSRARRIGNALGQIRMGESVTRTAFESGYDSLSGFNDAFRRILGDSPTGASDAPVMKVTRITTPLGPMVAGAFEDGVALLEFMDRKMLPRQFETLTKRTGCVFVPGDNTLLGELHDQLTAYFEGRLRECDLPVRTPGTPFQQDVWDALRQIPVGEVRSYADIAEGLGRAQAVRAVANANGLNRVAVLVPCHRVIGSDGSLTGYGGGLWRKRALLELEGALPASRA